METLGSMMHTHITRYLCWTLWISGSWYRHFYTKLVQYSSYNFGHYDNSHHRQWQYQMMQYMCRFHCTETAGNKQSVTILPKITSVGFWVHIYVCIYLRNWNGPVEMWHFSFVTPMCESWAVAARGAHSIEHNADCCSEWGQKPPKKSQHWLLQAKCLWQLRVSSGKRKDVDSPSCLPGGWNWWLSKS